MAFKSYKGWYSLKHPEKFIIPIDEYMKSYKSGSVNYKSKLELTAIYYADNNEQVLKWSLEPYPINYVKPTDQKIHRYFVDLYLEFNTGQKFIVEIKPHSQTIPPKLPKKSSIKNKKNYELALKTFAINTAKWESAKQFANDNQMQFIILTEKQLY